MFKLKVPLNQTVNSQSKHQLHEAALWPSEQLIYAKPVGDLLLIIYPMIYEFSMS